MTAPAVTLVEVCPPRTPYPRWRRRPKPAVWPVAGPDGRAIGEVWRTGESFNVYIYGTGVRVDTARDSIADALAAVGWHQAPRG